VAALIYIPTNSVKVFSFPKSLPVPDVCFLDHCHFDWGKMKFQGSFALHFLMAKNVEDLFMYLLTIGPFLRTVYSIHLLIYLLDYLFFYCLISLISLYFIDIPCPMNI
jgi:hypothetical protein